MRRIFTAITAVSLAFSLVASATPANAAVAGYDSAYAGESAFLALTPGQTGTFTVFFANTGSTSWVRGSGSQVDLAACLDDKVTCNAQDATEAPFNSGWVSATRYATQTQTTVAPGQIGTFTYNVAVPAAQAAGTYRFNGATVLAATGADIRDEGYYQDVTVTTGTPAGTASITSITPTSGSTAGGTDVTITGSGFVCTPAFPAVKFGTNSATVISCGATSLIATSPAGAAGAVNLTVTNTGAAASNAVTYVYADTTRPTYTGVTVTGAAAGGTAVATVTFSEPVCNPTSTNTAAADWTVTINGTTGSVTAESAPTCNSATAPTNGVTSFNVLFNNGAGAIPNGSFVALTLNEDGITASRNENYRDAAFNKATAPRTNTTNATAADTTAPTLVSASGNGGSTTLTLTFSEPVWCSDPLDAGDVQITTGTTTIASSGPTTCGTTAQAATTSYEVTLASAMASQTSYSVTLTTTANETKDVTGNNIVSPATTSFTSGVQDTTSPTLTDTRVVTNTGTTNFGDVGDKFTITFSEAMTIAASATISGQDSDTAPTTGTLTCGGEVTCSLSADKLTLTVTFQIVPAFTGTGGTQAGWQLPVTITATSGITDTGGNVPNLAGSADRVIDVE